MTPPPLPGGRFRALCGDRLAPGERHKLAGARGTESTVLAHKLGPYRLRLVAAQHVEILTGGFIEWIRIAMPSLHARPRNGQHRIHSADAQMVSVRQRDHVVRNYGDVAPIYVGPSDWHFSYKSITVAATRASRLS